MVAIPKTKTCQTCGEEWDLAAGGGLVPSFFAQVGRYDAYWIPSRARLRNCPACEHEDEPELPNEDWIWMKE